MIGVSEAINLGIRLGLEPEMIAQVINTSSGRCWSSDTYNPCPGIIEGIPSSNNYQGGFASQLMTKVSRDDFFGKLIFWARASIYLKYIEKHTTMKEFAFK